jgi:hypothetical protein
MKSITINASDRLTADEMATAEAAAAAAGLSLDQWMERQFKAAIYAPVLEAANRRMEARSAGEPMAN